MNTEKNNLTKARKLLAELATLEDVDNVLGNYDAKAYAVFSTCYNNNNRSSKTVEVSMPEDVKKLMLEHISHRISEIKKELESL